MNDSKNNDGASTAALEIVEGLRAGENGAAQALFDQYWQPILYLTQSAVRDRDRAKDITQDTLLLVIKKAQSGEIREPEKLSAFIYGVAKRLRIADQRLEQRRKTTPSLEQIARTHAQTNSPYDEITQDETVRLVRQLIDEMPVTRDRIVLKQHYVLDVPKTTTCEQLGLKPEHYDRVLYRARQRLKQLITERAGGSGSFDGRGGAGSATLITGFVPLMVWFASQVGEWLGSRHCRGMDATLLKKWAIATWI